MILKYQKSLISMDLLLFYRKLSNKGIFCKTTTSYIDIFILYCYNFNKTIYNTPKKMRKTAMKHAINEDIYYATQKEIISDVFKIRFCGITYPDKTYEISRVNPSSICIEYVEKGSGTVHAGNKTFHPEEGDSYILHTKTYHHYYSNPSNPWKKHFVVICGSLIENLIEGYQLNNAYLFKGLDTKEELEKIIELAKNKKGDLTYEVISIVNKILYKMKMHTLLEKKAPDIAEKMRDFLNENAVNKFRIEDLCEYVSKSESHTIRIFKEAYGITPYAYVLNKKISLAKDLLVNTNLPIKQVSSNLNFADEYYFSNVFKAKVGLSPNNYRKSKKAIKSE